MVIKRAIDCKVASMIITGVCLEESKEAQAIAKKFNLFSTAGCHPTHSLDWKNKFNSIDEYIQQLVNLIKHDQSSFKRIVAIGECGLDYDRLCFSPKQDQIEMFIKQLECSSLFNLPIFFHQRNAHSDFINIVEKYRHLFNDGVVHSFTGSVEEMKYVVEKLNLYIGINGCSLKTSENLQMVQEIPLDRIMIETDAPWCDIRPTHASFGLFSSMAQYDFKKKEKFVFGSMVKGRNEPCMVIDVLQVVAKLKNMSIDQLSEIIYQNTIRVFKPLGEV
jgi:TatD DNase family protein